jgi:hypothetical protein
MNLRPDWRDALMEKKLQMLRSQNRAASLIQDAKRMGLSLKIMDGQLRIKGGSRHKLDLIKELRAHEYDVLLHLRAVR